MQRRVIARNWINVKRGLEQAQAHGEIEPLYESIKHAIAHVKHDYKHRMLRYVHNRIEDLKEAGLWKGERDPGESRRTIINNAIDRLIALIDHQLDPNPGLGARLNRWLNRRP